MNTPLYWKCAKLRIPPKEKSVLLVLASFAPNKDCIEAYPSVGTLAECTSLCRTTVKKQLRNLEAKRIIEPQGNTKGGKGCSTTYVIHPENWIPVRRVTGIEESYRSDLRVIPVKRVTTKK